MKAEYDLQLKGLRMTLLEEMNKEKTELKIEYESKLDKLQKENDRITAGVNECSQQEIELNKLKKELNTNKRELDDLNKLIEKITNKNKNLESIIEEKDDEIKRSNDTIEDLNEKIVELNKEIVQMNSISLIQKDEKYIHEINELKIELQNEKNHHKEREDIINQIRTEYERRITTLNATIKEDQLKLKQYLVDKIDFQCQSAVLVMDNYCQCNEYENELNLKNEEIKKLNEDMINYKKEVEDRQSRLSLDERKVNELIDQVETYKLKLEKNQEIIKELEEKNAELNANSSESAKNAFFDEKIVEQNEIIEQLKENLDISNEDLSLAKIHIDKLKKFVTNCVEQVPMKYYFT